MSYIEELNTYGRPEKRLNVWRMAEDIAAALGGTVPEGNEPDKYYAGRVNLLSGLSLLIRPLIGAKFGRAGIQATMPYELTRKLARGGGTFETTVDAERPLTAIVGQIRVKVLPDAEAALADLQARAVRHDAARAEAERFAAELVAAVPGLAATFANADALEADLRNTTGPYFAGRLSSSGSVRIDRIDGVTFNRAKAALAALLAPEPA